MRSKSQTSYLMDAVKKIDLKAFVEREAGATFAQKGHNKWMGVCPLHGDSNPSFSITLLNDGAWVYKCFGCLSSGTIIDFCMERFSLSSPWEAAMFAAEKEGVKCDSSMIVKASKEAKIQTDRQYETDLAHFVASEYCRMLLRSCGGDEETMTWVARTYSSMNHMLDDGTASAASFDPIRVEASNRMSKIGAKVETAELAHKEA